MNSNEFKILAASMKAAYGSKNFLADAQSVKLWYRMLRDLDYELASAAVLRHISLNEFPPTIAGIRNACAEVVQTNDKDWLEGWNMVQRMIGRYGYNRTDEAMKALREYDELTADIAGMLGWQNLCLSDNPTADRANFRQSYETKKRRAIEHAKLPPAVRDTIGRIADGLKLETEGSLESNGEKVCIADSNLPVLQIAER